MPVTQAPLHYDPFAADTVADPYHWYRRLQGEAPLYHQDALDFWVLSRYGDVLAGARAHGSLSSAEGIIYTRQPLPMMLTMDPPDHTRLRRIVARDFTPTSVAAWRGLVEGLAREAVDRMLDEGTTDAVAAVASPLPILVIAEILGVPSEDYPQFRLWSDQIVESLALNDPNDVERANRTVQGILSLQQYVTALVEERRQAPRNDLLSRLLQPRAEGTLSDSEVFWFSLLLLVAANAPTTNPLGNILHTSASEPEVWNALRANPQLIAGAIEESLRHDSPIQGFFRTVIAPYAVQGVEIPVDERVLLLFGAANRDPDHFDDPDIFRVDRNPADHLGFGSGIHLCLGAHLARLEASAVLHELARRVRRIECAGEPVRGDNPILRGMAKLPLNLTAA
ncbi:MAG: cytochrome P450 [Acidimicrobiia bacterium]|nr:cytochrome P450 [Acidimicrobiia bacterium]